jgi:hypothetical protein
MSTQRGRMRIAAGKSPHRLHVSVAGLAVCECGMYSIEYPSPPSDEDTQIVTDAYLDHVRSAYETAAQKRLIATRAALEQFEPGIRSEERERCAKMLEVEADHQEYCPGDLRCASILRRCASILRRATGGLEGEPEHTIRWEETA